MATTNAKELDPRILRVGIEVGGKLKMYEGLWANVSIAKYANPIQNEAQIQIANLAKDVRDYILTETSPYNRRRQFKRVVIEAGRESFGASRIYSGNVITATISQPPDIILTMTCKTAWSLKGNILAYGLPPISSLAEVAQQAASTMGLSLQFAATNKNIANFAYSGSAADQVKAIGNTGGVDAYIDDDKFIVKDKNKPLTVNPHVLSEKTGMVGIPEPTDQGIRVKFMFDPKTRLGSQITINSVINPAMNGSYIIYKLNYDLSSRDTPFYCIAECRRLGFRYGLY